METRTRVSEDCRREALTFRARLYFNEAIHSLGIDELPSYNDDLVKLNVTTILDMMNAISSDDRLKKAVNRNQGKHRFFAHEGILKYELNLAELGDTYFRENLKIGNSIILVDNFEREDGPEINFSLIRLKDPLFKDKGYFFCDQVNFLTLDSLHKTWKFPNEIIAREKEVNHSSLVLVSSGFLLNKKS